MTIGGMPALATARQFYHEFQEDELMVRAGDLAFRFFLALFPLMLVLATGGGLVADIFGVDDPTDRVMEWFGDTLPDDAASVVRGQVDGVVNGANTGLFSIGLLVALWAGSSGTGSLIKAINKTYGTTESRPFWLSKLLALGVTVVGGLLLLGLIVGLVIAQVYAEDIASRFGVGAQYNLVVGLAQVPLVIIVVLVAIALLYWLAPSRRVPFHWISPGAIMFILLWVPFTVGFAFYVANFGSYNETYGTLGGVVILMFWFYYTSLLLLAGSELNAVLTVERSESAPEPGFLAERPSDGRAEEPAPHGREVPANGRVARPGVLGLAGLFLAAFAIKPFDR